MCFRAVFEDLFDTKNHGARLFLFATYDETIIDIKCQLPQHVSFSYLAEEWQKIAAYASCECNFESEGHFIWLETLISRRYFLCFLPGRY